MLQQMYSSTMLSNLIQQLISNTLLPKYKLIQDNEMMSKGVIYQCRNRLLRCTKSGYFPGVAGLTGVLDYLRVSDFLFATNTEVTRVDDDGFVRKAPLTVTDRRVKFIPMSAEWETLSMLDVTKPSYAMEAPTLRDNSYTTRVHKYLGEYLRWINNSTSVNLMPLYNCYNRESLHGWGITDSGIVPSNNSLTVVPVKFNQTYTISANCDAPVRIGAAFISDRLLKDPTKQKYLHEYISDTVTRVGSLQKSHPITYRIDSDQCYNSDLPYSKLVEYEQYLCIVIDANKSDLSSLVVIEGDYPNTARSNCFDVSALAAGVLSKSEIDEVLSSDLSLLSEKNTEYRPFADKLVTYLLRYSIDSRDKITENIANTEKSVHYESSHPGMWDLKLRYILHQKYQKACKEYELNNYDILGYVDADVESACRKGLLS